jgi:hypothetical protein
MLKHAILSLLLALVVTVWFSLAALIWINAAGYSVGRSFLIPWNLLLLGLLWAFVFRAVRKRLDS